MKQLIYPILKLLKANNSKIFSGLWFSLWFFFAMTFRRRISQHLKHGPTAAANKAFAARKGRSLKSTFVTYSMALVVLTALALSVISLISETGRWRSYLNDRAKANIDVASRFLPEYIVRKDSEAITRYLASSLERDGEAIKSISIYDTSGQILYQIGEEFNLLADKALISELEAGSRLIEQRQAGGQKIAAPLKLHNKHIATLIYHYDTDIVATAISKNLALAVMVALIGSLLLIPLGWLVAQRAFKPLELILDFLKSDDLLHSDKRLSEHETPEFNALSITVNDMLDKLVGAQDEIRSIAYFDTLTKLPNKNSLLQEMQLAKAQQDRKNNVAASSTHGFLITLIEFQRLKWVDETLGPEFFALLMLHLAERLRQGAGITDHARHAHLRPGEETGVFRVGLDDFVFLTPKVDDQNQAERIANMLASGVSQPIEFEGHTLTLQARCGSALCSLDTATDDVLTRAKLALNIAKNGESHKPVFYSDQLELEAAARVKLEKEIIAAVETQDFRIVFQPKVDLAHGHIASAEALIRWGAEPLQGSAQYPPSLFIPVAEEIGLIGEIGQIALEKACRAGGRWQKMGLACAVSVNVSPRQFEESFFAERVLETLEDTGYPPHLLELEITEGLAISDPKHVTDVMRPLREKGVKLAIDDFGAGHSNLAALSKLSFDTFKIDRQFVCDLEKDNQNTEIVRLIIALAGALKLKTVAEGIETLKQAQILRQMNCHEGQGFYFSKPLNEVDFYKLAQRLRPSQSGHEEVLAAATDKNIIGIA